MFHSNFEALSKMEPELLTPDNPQLSEANNEPCEVDLSANDCTQQIDKVHAYVRESLASNTRRAYLSDLDHFGAWGGCIPATPEMVALYLAEHAEGLSVASLVRRVASISKANESRGFPNPCRAELIRATMRGIRRKRGCAQGQAKPLLREDLFRMIDTVGHSVKDTRDQAVLLLGFAGGFRRSELVAFDKSDIRARTAGDRDPSAPVQDRSGRRGPEDWHSLWPDAICPVLALERWLEISRIENGPVFHPVDRHGRIGVSRLSGDAISVIVRERVASAGLDPTGYSGHSLRGPVSPPARRRRGSRRSKSGSRPATPQTRCWLDTYGTASFL
jgi:integrase